MMELVHNRGISIRTYDLGDHCILIEGGLVDHRYRPRPDEVIEGAKVVHDMVIRLRVRGPGMVIEEAEAEMPHHPREQCQMVLPWIRNLEGLRIATGFGMKVKGIMGGTKGCAHLSSLIIAMGPSAVQGYWAAYGVQKAKMSLHEEAVKKLINTCYVWREDGPLVTELREALKNASVLV
jgi:hypothetical protein